MCGISIFLSKDNEDVIQDILKSLYNIQNRGYDSMGIAFVEDSSWNVVKYSSTNEGNCYNILKDEISNCQSFFGIAHTRWATHGGKNNINAHPHVSMNKKVIIVHNGIISNFSILKNFLIEKKYTFLSETDTEVISNLLEYYYLINNDFLKSIEIVTKELEGTWALGIINTDEPDKIYVTRHGSPLILGESSKYIVCSSEISGFANVVNNYIVIDNHDILCLSKNGYTSINTYTAKIYKTISENNLYNSYEYLTLKEIYDQPDTIEKAFNNGGRLKDNTSRLAGLDFLNNKVEEIDNIIGLGCGTSYHATMLLKYYFKDNKKINIITCHDASEFSEIDIPKKGKTLFILCSQSGETRDLLNILEICKNYNAITVGVINVVDSAIAQQVDCGVYINAGIEKAVASTKSFTSMLVVLSLISLYFNPNIKVVNSLRNLSMTTNNLLNSEKFKSDCNKLVTFVNTNKINNMFLLGNNKLFPIAKEGSLKIKEITYIHAEAYPAGSLKHGPFALLDNTTVTILLINNCNIKKLLSTYYEITSRETNCLIITDCKDENMDQLSNITNLIRIPHSKYYYEILFTISLQYIAYLLSISRNINPDKPRNLAKVVTVE